MILTAVLLGCAGGGGGDNGEGDKSSVKLSVALASVRVDEPDPTRGGGGDAGALDASDVFPRLVSAAGATACNSSRTRVNSSSKRRHSDTMTVVRPVSRQRDSSVPVAE